MARHAPLDLVDGDGQASPVELLHDKEVAAFCGIGNPEGFRRTILPLCGRVLDLKTFPDHHAYQAGDVTSLAAWAKNVGANFALTTQKDFVKLRTSMVGPVPLRALRIGLEIMDGLEALEGLLEVLVAGRDGAFAVNGLTGKHVLRMKIAVFCPNLVGDTVMATPTFRALRSQFPEAQLSAVIRPGIAPVLDGTPWLDDLILADHRSKKSQERTLAVVVRLRRGGTTSRCSYRTRSDRRGWPGWQAFPDASAICGTDEGCF